MFPHLTLLYVTLLTVILIADGGSRHQVLGKSTYDSERSWHLLTCYRVMAKAEVTILRTYLRYKRRITMGPWTTGAATWGMGGGLLVSEAFGFGAIATAIRWLRWPWGT